MAKTLTAHPLPQSYMKWNERNEEHDFSPNITWCSLFLSIFKKKSNWLLIKLHDKNAHFFSYVWISGWNFYIVFNFEHRWLLLDYFIQSPNVTPIISLKTMVNHIKVFFFPPIRINPNSVVIQTIVMTVRRALCLESQSFPLEVHSKGFTTKV